MPRFWIEFVLVVFFVLIQVFHVFAFLLTWASKAYALNCWEHTSLLVPLSILCRNKIDGKLPVLLNRDEALVFICVHAFVQAHALLTSQKMKVFLIGAENVEKNVTQCSQEEKLSVALSLGDICSVLLCSLFRFDSFCCCSCCSIFCKEAIKLIEIDWCSYSYLQGGWATLGTYITNKLSYRGFLLKSFIKVHFCFILVQFLPPTPPSPLFSPLSSFSFHWKK